MLFRSDPVSQEPVKIPDFAVNPLHALAEAGYEVTGVVTQPDKPKGRGKTMLPTPVKEEALKHGFPVYQPVKVRDPEFLQVLEKLEPDIIVVAAFGQIIPKSILELPKYGFINIHASLLPKYRGAAPIQQAYQTEFRPSHLLQSALRSLRSYLLYQDLFPFS